MSASLTFIAGSRALEIIRDEGLIPERVRVVAGAAGGPKWLVLGGLDRALFGSFFKNRRAPLFMLGTSIGSWRFAALSQKSGMDALESFEKAYLAQTYSRLPMAAEVTQVSREILGAYIDRDRASEILKHPYIRLSMLSVRSRNFFALDFLPLLGIGMGIAGAFNFLSRSSMGLFFERALFYDTRDLPPFFDLGGFPIHKVPLTADNMPDAIMASGAIPLVMQGIRNVPGAPRGMYRDGGMIDYQLGMQIDPDPERIVLYPHYTDSIIPGWLDKHLSWRRAHENVMRNVLIVCPSKEFISALPYGKIPDRGDVMRFRGRDRERMDYWNRVVEMCRVMGEELLESVESSTICRKVVEYKQ
ncbi:MAG: patatin-like phospholipase family protein [Spirochaetes bacterium]|nr:patatin-like phospholipase family protein [Spirochaetota bacterium]